RACGKGTGGSMRRLNALVYVFSTLIGAHAVATGQWLRYPTEGIPRKPDGKADLTAPAPRLPDGHPDLSVVWHAAQPRRGTSAAVYERGGRDGSVRHRNRWILAWRQPWAESS